MAARDNMKWKSLFAAPQASTRNKMNIMRLIKSLDKCHTKCPNFFPFTWLSCLSLVYFELSCHILCVLCYVLYVVFHMLCGMYSLLCIFDYLLLVIYCLLLVIYHVALALCCVSCVICYVLFVIWSQDEPKLQGEW